jgi:biotin synthase
MEMKSSFTRHNWELEEILDLFNLPFNDLIFKSHSIHRQFWNPNEIQMCSLFNIKTGSCPEDCKYCSQSAFYNTGLKKEPLMSVDVILKDAKNAKENGAQRYCMGAAWRNLNDRDLPMVCNIISEVKKLGLQTCATFGMLTEHQAEALQKAGLEYYNHNIDTSEDHYKNIITTRTFQDRLDTLETVRNAGIKVCCGGILGLGETLVDRANMLRTLANLSEHPESTPINMLWQVPGTPLQDAPKVDTLEFIRSIAVARILLPKTFVRLSAGRATISDEAQAICFFAGANSIHIRKLLTILPNPTVDKDTELFSKLGLKPYENRELVTTD